MYTYKSWCIYTNLDENIRILCIYTILDVYIRILMYMYESWCIYTNLDVYIRILMHIYESWRIYTNLGVYITVLSCKFMILLFCPFLTSIGLTAALLIQVFAFDEVERKPNFGLWLCRVGCPVYGYILKNPHSCRNTKMAIRLILQGHVTASKLAP